MKRRHVLGGLLLAFACTPTGRRPEDADEPDDEVPPEPAPAPSEAPLTFADAREEAVPGVARRPTLVLVIPADDLARWRRGMVFGELLNHGSDADLAPLAMYEVVCATMAEIRRQFPELPKKEDPWLVLIDRTQANPRAQVFKDRDLDALASLEEPGDKDIDARIARIAALVRDTADPRLVERLAGLERSALPRSLAEELRITTDDLATARIDLAAAAAASLFFWGNLEALDPDNEWLREARLKIASASLAGVTRDRLTRTRPPRGARWARSHGCGTRIEGEEERHAVACGMGHIPERSSRFLSFYTEVSPF